MIILLVAAIVIAGIVYFGKYNSGQNNVPVNSPVGSSNPQGLNNIVIKDFSFNPATLNVNKGDTVVWTNEDSVVHRISGNSFQSNDLGNGQSYSFTFNSVGTFDYICSIHPSMKGTIIVK